MGGMDVVATTEHCMYCFDTLVSQLHPEYHAESAPAFPDDVWYEGGGLNGPGGWCMGGRAVVDYHAAAHCL